MPHERHAVVQYDISVRISSRHKLAAAVYQFFEPRSFSVFSLAFSSSNRCLILPLHLNAATAGAARWVVTMSGESFGMHVVGVVR